MKRELILHIGITKTGSTSIQRFIIGRRDELAARGVYYFTSPGRLTHSLLPASVVDDQSLLWNYHPSIWEGLKPAARISRFRDEWERELAALPDWAERCIISAEQIVGLLRKDHEIQRLADVLRPHFATIQVVVYLRRQDRHAISAYSQKLRGGVVNPPGFPTGRQKISLDYDYGEILDRFARVFGQETIRARVFQRDRLVSADVVTDFFHTAGIDIASYENKARESRNLEISEAGQRLLMLAGERMTQINGDFRWRDTPEWRQLAELVSDALPGRGWRPTQQEARAFMAQFSETNERARSRFFYGQMGLFDQDYDDFPLKRSVSNPHEVTDAALTVLMHDLTASMKGKAQAAMTEFDLLQRLGDTTGMVAALLKAIKANPNAVLPRQKLIEVLIATGDKTLARHHLESALQRHPERAGLKALLKLTEAN